MVAAAAAAIEGSHWTDLVVFVAVVVTPLLHGLDRRVREVLFSRCHGVVSQFAAPTAGSIVNSNRHGTSRTGSPYMTVPMATVELVRGVLDQPRWVARREALRARWAAAEAAFAALDEVLGRAQALVDEGDESADGAAHVLAAELVVVEGREKQRKAEAYRAAVDLLCDMLEAVVHAFMADEARLRRVGIPSTDVLMSTVVRHLEATCRPTDGTVRLL